MWGRFRINSLPEGFYWQHFGSCKWCHPRSFHLLFTALAFLFLALLFQFLQTYDLRHLSIVNVANDFSKRVCHSLGAPWNHTEFWLWICGCTPGGFKPNVFNDTMPFVDVQCIHLWSYFCSKWLVKGSCTCICLCVESAQVYVCKFFEAFLYLVKHWTASAW